ncbi:hypothetical protein LB516_24005 [Mesorhizobium sp. CO1-1-7]|uniref:hypothetical protein n=1 Tax=Mesorhizobium sp. CO1-1-7 TaxID=2876632 RepID=UPI001CD0E0BD|nr:hypothetical protein [Mesorhizobium sp. CO1-1-7]MBZ9748299.1 hypothetical protein [Mesorhizobium sp. CO1-1-7]
MTTTFPAHWTRAIDRADASAFTGESDFAAFFRATSMVQGCFTDLTKDQQDNVLTLRDRFPAVVEAARRESIKEQDAALAGPRFFGNLAVGKPAPTIEQLKPELAAIEAEIGKVPKSDTWEKAIAKTNASFGRMAAHIYARRNGARGV